MESILPILGLTFLGSIAGLLGGIIILWKRKLAQTFSTHLIALAAGVILATAFLDLLPEAVDKGGENVFILALIGLVSFFLAEDFLLHFHHHESHKHSLKSIVPLITLGDSVHNFVDGLVIAITFLANPHLGLIVAIATFLHEIPQEIGDFIVMLSAGVSPKKVIIFNLLSACSSFLGALVAIFFAHTVETFSGILLSLATGMFLYISSADILPGLVKGEGPEKKWHIAGFFLLGIAIIFVLTKYMPA